MSDKRSFWSTIPGFATGLATLVTAGLGVWGIVQSGDSSPADSERSPSSSSPTEAGGSKGSDSSEDPPRAQLTPDPLDFGRQGVGRSSTTMTATLTNLGPNELTVDSAEMSGQDDSQFEVVENDCEDATLDERDNCEIKLRFSPKSVGDFEATIKVDHNGEDAPSETSLTGEGVLLQL